MTFNEFKNLDYPADTPMESVLADCLYRGNMSVNVILMTYTQAIERDRHENKMKFEEACVCMAQHLSGNYKGKDKEKLHKRMVHIFNQAGTFPHGVYDETYGYTEEDKKYWDEFFKLHYGIEL